MNLTESQILLFGVICLAGIALYGLLASRNFIKIIVTLQIFGKCAVLAIILAGNLSGKIELSQSMAVTVIVADTIIAAVGLALGMQIKKRIGSLDLHDLSKLRG